MPLLLGEQLLRAVLAHQLDAGLGQRRQVVRVHVLDRGEDLDRRAPIALAHALEVRAAPVRVSIASSHACPPGGR